MRSRLLFVLWLLLGLGLGALCGVALMVQPVRAHDAIPTAAKPNGWSYPLACCSGYDCREVTGGPGGLVREHGNGYEIATTGEVIPQTDAKIKLSPDGQFHWCSKGGRDDSDTICLFVPPPMF